MIKLKILWTKKLKEKYMFWQNYKLGNLMKNIVIIIVINFLLFSCNSVDFVYKNKTNLVNPYEKTKVYLDLICIYEFIYPNVIWSNEK